MQPTLTIPEKTRYRDSWQHNAATFSDQKCYSWMVDQLGRYSPKRILDIGCGTGEGIIALLDSGVDQIISLEENFDCIVTTAEKLKAQSRTAKIIPRLGYIEDEDGRHHLTVNNEPVLEGDGLVSLIHADLLVLQGDASLSTYFRDAPKFDAVTIWLSGTYEMRRSCKSLDFIRITNPREYVLHVQNRVYELADSILKVGGVLQVVDRGLVLESDTLKEMLLDDHRDQASVTTLEVSELDFMIYNEPQKKGISMVRGTSDKSGIIDDGRRAMHSVISIKR
jgi:SAM-dependent methyltransferase